MSELSDFISKYDFKCKKCNTNLTLDSSAETAFLYGLIVLAGHKDGLIGWSCPICNALVTNLTRVDGDPFLFLHSIHMQFSANNLYKNVSSNIDNTLMYRSFPFGHISSKDVPVSKQAFLIHHDYDIITDLNINLSIDPLLGDYFSLKYNNYAIGPGNIAYCYRLPAINYLLNLENENQIKSFPRYEIIDWLTLKIDNFCWNNRVNFALYKEGLTPSHCDFNINPKKDLVKKPYDFLTILDSVNSLDYFTIDVDISIHKFVRIIDSGVFLKKPIQIYKNTQFSELAWEVFHSDWMHETLNNLAEDFISSYIFQISKTNNTKESILILVGSYIEKLYNAIIDKDKRKFLKKETSITSQKRIEEAETSFKHVKIISNSNIINELKISISRMAPLDLADSFLILGERGTGKDLFAKAIHEASNRKGNFIKIDCGSIPEKLFESEVFGYTKGAFTGALKDTPGKISAANNGTIFFDEIGNLPLSLQPKLLRALQDRQFVPVGSNQSKKIDAKFIFATNKNLEKMVDEDLFMADLYDRFKRPQLWVPPLRERKDDVPLLATHFIEKYDSPETGDKGLNFIRLSKECIDALKKYDWPGNIRELEQVIKEIILNRLAQNDRSAILELDLPNDLFSGHKGSSKPTLKIREKLPGNTRIKGEDIIRCMNEFGHNKTKVAEQLGVTYKTIWLRCKELDI